MTVGYFANELYSHSKTSLGEILVLSHGFWEVPGTNGQLANFSPIAQVDP